MTAEIISFNPDEHVNHPDMHFLDSNPAVLPLTVIQGGIFSTAIDTIESRVSESESMGSPYSPVTRIHPTKLVTEPVPAQGERYVINKFTEAQDPHAAHEAWRIHANGYLAMGFVHPDAIIDGYLTEDIDKARGPHIDYYLASNPVELKDRAVMRKINLEPSQSYRDLPGYKLCIDGISEQGDELLQRLEQFGRPFKELSALAREPESHPLAVHELIRNIIHDNQGKGEVWFFSIVTTTFDSLAKSFGASNFHVIGEDVPIDDERVQSRIALRPCVLNPDTFIATVYEEYEAATNPASKTRLRRSFMFLTEGLDPDNTSDRIREARSTIVNDILEA